MEHKGPFELEVNQPEEKFNLARAALLVAREEYPRLNVDACLQEIKNHAQTIRTRLKKNSRSIKYILKEAHDYLFRELGFKGTLKNFYDPRNSFLNDVLDRRTGAPITLSILYMEVMKELSLQTVGVVFPGHFLVKIKTPELQLIVDPFHRGALLSWEDLQVLLQHTTGKPAFYHQEYLKEAGKKQVLYRLLSSLRAVYLMKDEFVKSVKVMKMMFALAPSTASIYGGNRVADYLIDEHEKMLDDFVEYVKLDLCLNEENVFEEQQMGFLRRMVKDFN